MLKLQKIFLLVRFFNRISCNEGLNAKISRFFVFSVNPLGLECSRSRKTALLLTWHKLKKCKNLHPYGASRMVWKRGRCWKSPIFEGKLWVFIEWNENNENEKLFFILAFFTACFYHFLFWGYLNSSMYEKVFVRHAAPISKFKWFEQPWVPCTNLEIIQSVLVGVFHSPWYCLLNWAQLLWLKMALFSKKALWNIEKHS